MTTKTLLDTFECYYGEIYSGMLLGIMTEYLYDFSDEERRAAVKVLLKRVSRSFGKVPGISEFEKHIDEIKYEAERNKPLQLPEPESQDFRSEAGLRFIENLKRMFCKKQDEFKKSIA